MLHYITITKNSVNQTQRSCRECVLMSLLILPRIKLTLFIQHLNKFSLPFDDIKVVPVVSLVDDVLLSLNPRLEHGV